MEIENETSNFRCHIGIDDERPVRSDDNLALRRRWHSELYRQRLLGDEL